MDAVTNPVYDLHSHTRASDGTLTPTELVERAAKLGVNVLALTDHDTTAGMAEAVNSADQVGLSLVHGVEISVSWGGTTVHIVGLHVDIENEVLQAGLDANRRERDSRAQRMGERLEKQGIKDATVRAAALATGGLVARTHYCRVLVEDGLAKDIGDAIRKYLKKGRPAFVAGKWAGLEEAVGWIVAAGGVAVIAHPARYGFTATKLRELIRQFKQVGGQALEVISGSHSPQDKINMAAHARRAGLAASCGSDYHGPENPWVELGRLSRIPEGLVPVWSLWDKQVA